jgi:hypothetical protein
MIMEYLKMVARGLVCSVNGHNWKYIKSGWRVEKTLTRRWKRNRYILEECTDCGTERTLRIRDNNSV